MTAQYFLSVFNQPSESFYQRNDNHQNVMWSVLTQFRTFG